MFSTNKKIEVIVVASESYGSSARLMVQKIIKHWEEIIEITSNTPKPYLFLISVSGRTELKYDGNNCRDK